MLLKARRFESGESSAGLGDSVFSRAREARSQSMGVRPVLEAGVRLGLGNGKSFVSHHGVLSIGGLPNGGITAMRSIRNL